eukprot:GHUV01037849.1.p1 GENE.GHUV01037849.1~~GHUV01037849.1.p1  ORF type:complete len:273 (-),score=56.85 GHUV01037849.1:444-1262(-)
MVCHASAAYCELKQQRAAAAQNSLAPSYRGRFLLCSQARQCIAPPSYSRAFMCTHVLLSCVCSRRLCNPKMPRLLSYLLGNKVNLVTIRKDQAVGIREEYHAFRNKAVWVMGTMPMLLYLGMKRADHVTEGGKDKITLTPALLTGLQVYLAWLCYFYVAMALRECVLLVNGSHIRSWWISHHMWSALGSLLMLALPISSPTVYYFAENFMLWSAFQAGVMLVQNRYQKRRMYTRIALGKNSAMDVVSGESSGSAGQLMVLYPLLFSKSEDTS